ncbi:MAG TPA: MmgE/PrpD family protein [Mycobacteriales bacterium]|nr:MmgE/PrpD family protein [Mycobacteriales bacterium]
MGSIGLDLAGWAAAYRPSPADLALADRALADTVAVALAARDHPVTALAAALGPGGRWAAAGHVLDFDDLHMSSTSHVSVVCVPAVLAVGGAAPDLARAYLAGAGVMARLGDALGWSHYRAGWHATGTAGALGAAAGAAVALGLPADGIATALALAVPAAGGVQRAFGTDAKSLQVGFAVDAGVRAARLAAAGAGADPAAVSAWFGLVGGAGPVDLGGPAVPGGLAIKVYPCCYALQRPISALASLAVDPAAVTRIVLRTPEATVAPLIHHRPTTGLQGKFSLEYAAATALLDPYSGFDAFTDAAVRRPAAQELVSRVETVLEPGGDWLLAGSLTAAVSLRTGETVEVTQQFPPGSPARPPTPAELAAKIADCTAGLSPGPVTWSTAASVLRAELGGGA